MGRVVVSVDRCKGCLLCTTVCPPNILIKSNSTNALGYKYICLDPEYADQCKGCSFCAEICPDSAILVFKEIRPKKSS